MRAFTLFITLLCLCSSLQSKAQTTEKRARIRYLFSLMKIDSLQLKQMEAATATARKSAAAIFGQGGQMPDSTLIKRQEEMMQKVMVKARENGLKLINEDMVEIYDQQFSDADIDAFCVFYQTPAGRKMIDRQSVITKEILDRSVTKYQPSIMKLITDYIQETRREFDERSKN
ncbi:hypothetical protein FAES_4913 [Fibrella aestuarina BUZ 2]|uniref:DUF2059 domain-containing protein n=1 Tax=Fibrella aestuarina BUZ 2 TaxID=1166018 RepID=I0KFK9_9BACT|nr:DUF2059 domain-containing protein [Fibrella aestuarina]CCH02912.1 hypothetical protein FAES_4913 [Fibrella aestuarina BUZ 2]